MEPFLRYWMRWPSVEYFLSHYAWAWPFCEVLHFVGLVLLVGIIGLFDLRVLGVAKGLPFAPLQRLIPWSVFGFFLCVISGLMFVTGIGANLYGVHPYDVLMTDTWLQLKLIFILLAGLNAAAFYVTGASHRVDALGPDDDAPAGAKVIAGTSLSLWLAVVYFGRLIPWGLQYTYGR
jgi:hypothetical protein